MKKGLPFVLFVACFFFWSYGSQIYAQKPRLTVGLMVSSDMLPTLVAEHSGHFSQEGLTITPVVFRSGVQLMQSILGGDTQIGICDTAAFIQANAAGGKVIAPWGNSNLMPFALVSRAEIRTVNGLRGKKIAISSYGSLTDFLTRYVLKNKGLDPSRDVTILGIGGVPTRFAAVLSGSADASLISSAYFSKAKEAGLNILFMLSEMIPEWPLSVVCTREELLAQREREFRSFLQGYRQGVVTAKNNREAGIRALQKGLRFDLQTATEGYHAYVNSLPDDGHVAEKGIELMIEQMLEGGTLKKKLSVSDLIDYKYQREIQRR